jgi:hypothetical protein
VFSNRIPKPCQVVPETNTDWETTCSSLGVQSAPNFTTKIFDLRKPLMTGSAQPQLEFIVQNVTCSWVNENPRFLARVISKTIYFTCFFVFFAKQRRMSFSSTGLPDHTMQTKFQSHRPSNVETPVPSN